jgi:hypothetical protein
VSAEKLQAARMALTEDEKAAGLAFMKSILPSFEDGLLALLYEEHEWDLERTIEALLILTNVNGDETTAADETASGSDLSSPQSSSTPSSSTSVSDDDNDEENDNHDDLGETEEAAAAVSEDWERIDEIIARMVREGEKESGVGGGAAGREITFVRDEEEDEGDETDDGVCDELVDSLEVLRRRYLTNADDNEAPDVTETTDASVAGSAFTSNLDTLAEMFPEYDRQTLAVTLEANADDIEATTEEILAQAFGAALQQRGNRRGRQQFLGPKKKTVRVENVVM